MRFLIFLFPIVLFGNVLRIANYNVENLFDLKYDGTEYKEYIPNTPIGWNEETYLAKLNNIARVISAVNPDVIGLEEVESEDALDDLRDILRQYPYRITYKYSVFADDKKRSLAVSNALLSKYPIKYAREIEVSKSPRMRNILEVGIEVGDEVVIVFVNHWKAKSGNESKRVETAKHLMARLQELDKNTPYILIGDFNSNYNEFQTFINTKLNDTDGITGINHILGTVIVDDWKITQWFKNLLGLDLDIRFVTIEDLKKSKDNSIHYNLWLELEEDERWSHKSGKKKGTLDNMIISRGLVDGKGIEYIEGSFQVFRGAGTVRNGKVYRWQRDRKRRHIGKGFSDHLLIYADFQF